ncbi:MAG: hypothetical protein AB8H03_11190 [Saprospiraceae bacterium]
MNFYKIILLSFSSIFFQSCSSQLTQNNNISISIPTIEQEATSIWRTINDIEFFEKQGYKINLPENDLIQSLIEKSKNGKFGSDDFSEIYNLLEVNIYKKDNYELALKKVSDQKKMINKLVNELYILQKKWNWEFKMFENYNIVFTLYGTGGSYDPDLGIVTLFTTSKGEFMNYDKPANTIIHEIIHMGIEKSIVQKYNLPHGLKERIADAMVFLLFGKSLPEYKIQNMGDKKIDQSLKKKTDINELDSIIKKFMETK